MSSVVISGDTSGSVTLQAPAVSGSTVLTLPATSGTVITGPGGVTSVASGGTGASTLTANNVILGNGTSAVAFVAPGSSGNVLTSNGTTWASTAAASGQLQTELFTTPGTWTNPGSVTNVRVTVIGGGGGSNAGPGVGGTGGVAVALCTVSGPVVCTVGAGGTGGSPGAPGGTSSFGSFLSATGGVGGPVAGGIAAPGTGTVTTGTALITSNLVTLTYAGPTPGAPVALSTSTIIPNAWGRLYKETPVSPAATTYSQSTGIMAGAGGSAPSPTARGGNGGLIVVEFVG